MYIKSIVLDGFKSYGKRTEINLFDPKFNAITGLNGSGKSNILDSICFVLGISSLVHVRATSLQDLIYKSGNSTVKKATVSITFDNLDKSQSPSGFQHCDEITVTRQIVMGGKNKYMINGTTAQNKRVQDLFCSVQMNVNNPHFLIMQGRITKVLNMKPVEILAMLEEAAGTRMYETKRIAAQKTIEKKDKKLDELNEHIRTDLGPKLDKLKEDRRILLEYQRIERELKHARIIYKGWQYFETKAVLTNFLGTVESKQKEINDLKQLINENKQKTVDIEQMLENSQKDKKNDEKLQSIEAELKEKDKCSAVANATEKNTKENLSSKEKELKRLLKSLNDDETALSTRESEMSKMNETFTTLKEAEEKDRAALARAQKKFEAVNAGMELGEDGEAVTLQEQLISYKQEASEASTVQKQASMKLQFCQTQLKEKQHEMGTASNDYKKNKYEMDNLEKEIKTIEKQLSNINFSKENMQDLQIKHRNLKNECRGLRERIDHFEASNPQTEFRYRDPEPNFNRRSVKGLVCNLINVLDKSASTALEVAAGARLFNVVVNNDITSKKLLQNGNLTRRTTFIPLNKIKGHQIPGSVINFAQKLVGAENCQPALSLIQYDKELQPAMEYIFGGVFVCSDMNVAKKVTFHDKIRCKCVTLDGDVTDPSGTLSGGAKHKGSSILTQLETLKEYQAQLTLKEQELTKTEQELQNMNNISEKFGGLTHNLELNTHKYNLVKQCLQQTSYHLQKEEIENLKKSIAELTEQVKVNQEKEKVASKKAKELEDRVKNSKNDKETQLKDAEKELNALKKKSENSCNVWKQKEQDYETMQLEMLELKKAINNGKELIETCEKDIIELKNKLEECRISAEEAKTQCKNIQAILKEHKLSIVSKNKDLQAMMKKKNELLADNDEHTLEIKKKSIELSKLQNQFEEWKGRETELLETVNFDDPKVREAEKFTKKEVDDLLVKIKKSEENKAILSKTLNPQAQSMLEQEEKMYSSLLKRKKTVENDRKKIMSVMVDLDKKKVDTIKIAHAQISKDFGSIFGTLLPGTNAKLEKVEGKEITSGVQIKVSIGGIWKESLNELSGGQRSLVALSLILAMLLYKPAPIYILDEVDAALDLSHTQNIGNMLRKHFKHSQFIIVSLKDGMFNNANVLYKTKFVDGMSTVQRSTNQNA